MPDCSSKPLDTLFAPAERSDQQQLQQERQTILRTEFMHLLLDSMQDLVLILNQHRQIVAINKRLLETFGVANPELLIGMRPGEALGCVHAAEGPGGCGTGMSCTICGAVLTILSSQQSGNQAHGECRVMLGRDGGSALDLEVMASPIDVEGSEFTIFSIRDISSDKRRHLLERVFFHDILNTAGGIQGLATLLAGGAPPEKEETFKNWMLSLSENLIEDIQHQKHLLDAERGDFVPKYDQLELHELLEEITHLYSHHERTPGRILELTGAPNCTLTSDRSILRRIVGNMVLNALEASNRGETITIQASCNEDSIRIEVTNPGEMPRDVQLSLFNRSFSTKQSSGRGIGTYSMKLFGERYLGGRVGFISADNRTTFFIELPRHQPPSAHNLPAQ